MSSSISYISEVSFMLLPSHSNRHPVTPKFPTTFKYITTAFNSKNSLPAMFLEMNIGMDILSG